MADGGTSASEDDCEIRTFHFSNIRAPRSKKIEKNCARHRTRREIYELGSSDWTLDADSGVREFQRCVFFLGVSLDDGNRNFIDSHSAMMVIRLVISWTAAVAAKYKNERGGERERKKSE